jgi:hypothetical protein
MISLHLSNLNPIPRQRILMGLISLANSRIFGLASMEHSARTKIYDARPDYASIEAGGSGPDGGIDARNAQDLMLAERKLQLQTENLPDPFVEVAPWVTFKLLAVDQLAELTGGKMMDQSMASHINFKANAEFQYNTAAARAKMLASNGRISAEAIRKAQYEEWQKARARTIASKDAVLAIIDQMYGLEGEWDLDTLFDKFSAYDQMAILAKIVDSINRLCESGFASSSYRSRDLAGDMDSVTQVEKDVINDVTAIFDSNTKEYYAAVEARRPEIALVERVIQAEKEAASASRKVDAKPRTVVKVAEPIRSARPDSTLMADKLIEAGVVQPPTA